MGSKGSFLVREFDIAGRNEGGIFPIFSSSSLSGIW